MPNPRYLACYLDPLFPVAARTSGGLGPKEGPSGQLPLAPRSCDDLGCGSWLLGYAVSPSSGSSDVDLGGTLYLRVPDWWHMDWMWLLGHFSSSQACFKPSSSLSLLPQRHRDTHTMGPGVYHGYMCMMCNPLLPLKYLWGLLGG